MFVLSALNNFFVLFFSCIHFSLLSSWDFNKRLIFMIQTCPKLLSITWVKPKTMPLPSFSITSSTHYVLIEVNRIPFQSFSRLDSNNLSLINQVVLLRSLTSTQEQGYRTNATHAYSVCVVFALNFAQAHVTGEWDTFIKNWVASLNRRQR